FVPAVCLLAATKVLLFRNEALDPCRDALITHVSILASCLRNPSASGYDRPVPRSDALVDEIANELATWPGVRIERRPDGAAMARYEHSELGSSTPIAALWSFHSSGSSTTSSSNTERRSQPRRHPSQAVSATRFTGRRP